MPFSRRISPQSTRRSQRIFKIFFLGVLCDLCGELLCFLFDQTGSIFGAAAVLIPRIWYENIGYRNRYNLIGKMLDTSITYTIQREKFNITEHGRHLVLKIKGGFYGKYI
jgi:hypothetical protein